MAVDSRSPRARLDLCHERATVLVHVPGR